MTRLTWENEKYRILVRRFEGDVQIFVDYWKIDKKGKTKPVRYSDLPQYVQEKIIEMKSQATAIGN